MTEIIALSGSLRRASLNTALLRAAMDLAPPSATFTVYDGIGDLPLFNPDLEGSEPASVLAFRDRLSKADAVIIASPEYAHGVTGVIKNALDWIVGSGELYEKPVALLNASPRATVAYAALEETMTVMAARIVPDASLTIPLIGSSADDIDILADPELCRLIRQSLVALVDAAGKTNEDK